ncbi:hypothetical protein RB594_002413 [Gaeumannomyces avenae]
MPIAALAINFSWEPELLVNAFYVAEAPLERAVVTIWCLIDLGLFYGVVRHGPREWSRGADGRCTTWVSRNLVGVFGLMVVLSVWANWAFAHWWIENEAVRREGKFYGGKLVADTTEMGYWTVCFAQVFLSAASLAQLLVRERSGGVSWGHMGHPLYRFGNWTMGSVPLALVPLARGASLCHIRDFHILHGFVEDDGTTAKRRRQSAARCSSRVEPLVGGCALGRGHV